MNIEHPATERARKVRKNSPRENKMSKEVNGAVISEQTGYIKIRNNHIDKDHSLNLKKERLVPSAGRV